MTQLKFNNRTRNTSPYVNNVFDSLFRDALTKTNTAEQVPAVNIYEQEDKFVIELAAPGLKKEDFQIALNENNLSISAKVESEKNNVVKHYSRKEFNFNSFSRSFNLPEAADFEKITAVYKDGILNITIGKKDELKLKPREIVVS